MVTTLVNCVQVHMQRHNTDNTFKCKCRAVLSWASILTELFTWWLRKSRILGKWKFWPLWTVFRFTCRDTTQTIPSSVSAELRSPEPAFSRSTWGSTQERNPTSATSVPRHLPARQIWLLTDVNIQVCYRGKLKFYDRRMVKFHRKDRFTDDSHHNKLPLPTLQTLLPTDVKHTIMLPRTWEIPQERQKFYRWFWPCPAAFSSSANRAAHQHKHTGILLRKGEIPQ